MSLKKAITEKVIAGLILTIILYGCSFVHGFYPAIWNLTKTLWSYVTASASVPRWLLGILILAFSIQVLRVLIRVFRKKAEPSVLDYCEDIILDLTWRWQNYGPDDLTSLWCFCPACDTALIYNEEKDYSEYGRGRTVVHFSCDHCGKRVKTFDSDKNYLLQRVTRQIDRSRRNGDWRKRIRTATT